MLPLAEVLSTPTPCVALTPSGLDCGSEDREGTRRAQTDVRNGGAHVHVHVHVVVHVHVHVHVAPLCMCMCMLRHCACACCVFERQGFTQSIAR